MHTLLYARFCFCANRGDRARTRCPADGPWEIRAKDDPNQYHSLLTIAIRRASSMLRPFDWHPISLLEPEKGREPQPSMSAPGLNDSSFADDVVGGPDRGDAGGGTPSEGTGGNTRGNTQGNTPLGNTPQLARTQ
jgi:hypothetical protein